MNEAKKMAVIYCRVSTKEQVEEGNSLVTQEKLCKEYALKYGYEVVQCFIEQGESAKTANRTELKKLLNFCGDRKNKIQAVIAYKIDRISRNTDDYSYIRLLLKSHGVEIKSTSEQFASDPAGRFMENIIANVAQFDNDIRTERSVNGMKDAMREGRYVWRAPIGYSNVRIQGKATIVANESASIVADIFKRVAQNHTAAEEVRKYANDTGLRTQAGRILSKSQFYRLLRNRLYAGWIIKMGESHKGLFEPLITEELFEQVQLVLKYKKKRDYTYKVKHPDFPLRRFIYHPSGTKLSGYWSKGRNNRYAYYFYRKEKLTFTKDKLETTFKAFLSQFQLQPKHFKLFKDSTYRHLVKQNQTNGEKARIIRQQVLDLKSKQTQLVQKNLQGVITDNILQEQLGLIDHELLSLNSILASLPDKTISYDEILEANKEFILNPAETWSKLPFMQRLRLQWFYFPKGIIFDGVICRTTEIARILQARTLFFSEESHSVPLMHQKTNTLDIPTSKSNHTRKAYWEELGKEIEALADLYNADP